MKNIKPHYFLLWLAGMVLAAGMLTLTKVTSNHDAGIAAPFLAFAFLPIIGLNTWLYYLTRNHQQLPGLKLVHIGFMVASILSIWICLWVRANDLLFLLTTVGVLLVISQVGLIINLIIGFVRGTKN